MQQKVPTTTSRRAIMAWAVGSFALPNTVLAQVLRHEASPDPALPHRQGPRRTCVVTVGTRDGLFMIGLPTECVGHDWSLGL